MPERHKETENYLFDCGRCGKALNPNGAKVESNAVYYVNASDERNPFEKEVDVAYRHTDETRQIRDQMVEENSLDVRQANNAIAREEVAYYPDDDEGGIGAQDAEGTDLITKENLEEEREVDPQEAKHDPDVVKIETEKETVDRPARLLVCKDCKKDGDHVLWEGEPLK